MPRLEEVRAYLRGLWLLIRNRPEGLRWLDFSTDGVLRSFWAFAWCMPASVVSWASWRNFYLSNMPEGTQTGLAFIVKLFILDAFGWLVPIVLVVALARPLGFPRLVGRIVTTTNWLSIPLSYMLAVPTVLRLVLPEAEGITVFLWFGLLVAAVAALYRVIHFISGKQALLSVTLTSLFLFPPLLVGEPLRRILGLLPG